MNGLRRFPWQIVPRYFNVDFGWATITWIACSLLPRKSSRKRPWAFVGDWTGTNLLIVHSKNFWISSCWRMTRPLRIFLRVRKSRLQDGLLHGLILLNPAEFRYVDVVFRFEVQVCSMEVPVNGTPTTSAGYQGFRLLQLSYTSNHNWIETIGPSWN